MATPREVLQQYDIRPNKKLGQSFLVDVNTIHKISDACRITSQDTVVEIGSGIGVLTGMIAEVARQLIAVEIDSRLLEVLHDRFDQVANVDISAGDILKFDFTSKSNKYHSILKVVGNVPYNISSPVLFHLLANRPVIESFTLMLQKEVVERLVSEPDHKSYGVPSVLLQMYADVERLFDVSANCFYPRPKVESSILHGTFREKPRFQLEDEVFFGRVVKAAFAQRRKMLSNNLKHANFLEELTDDQIKESLDKAGIDGKRRGETLSLEEFSKLSNILKYQLTNLP